MQLQFRKGQVFAMKFICKFVKLFFISLLLLMLPAGCIFYAFKIEPYRLTVNEYCLTEKKQETESIKIVQFSDTHIKEDFTYGNLNKIVNSINKQDPDIVIFTGDLYDNYAKYNDDVNIIAELQKINAKYDKIAIWGNHDHGGGAVRQYESIMEQAGFILLKNENWYITTDAEKKILFTGLDDSMLGNMYMPDSTKIYDSDYEVLLSHESDTVDNFQEYDYNLALSGHSHGGQVNVPFIPAINQKAISCTSLTEKYLEGMYELNSRTKLYVNTGIGTTHISARFGVVPEISVFVINL